MTVDELKTACEKFEREEGIDAFLAAMAQITTERMARHGIDLQFDAEADDCTLDTKARG